MSQRPSEVKKPLDILFKATAGLHVCSSKNGVSVQVTGQGEDSKQSCL